MLRLLSIFLLCSTAAQAAEQPYAREGLTFSISARTPEQLRAFYSARGFPDAMIQEIVKTCFLTVGIQNRRNDVVWLELANWRMTDANGQTVRRISRPEWNQRWEQLSVPYASRATFGWTQLPESRDLQPGEPVGGNIAVDAPASTFTLIAQFRTEVGTAIDVVAPGLRCPNPEATP